MSRLAFALAALLAAAAPAWSRAPATPSPSVAFPGWPSELDGQALEPVPLTAAEGGFTAGFPGRIARFASGPDHLIVRWIATPTRKLHPARHCLRATGYDLGPARRCRRDEVETSCFDARRDGTTLAVSERIVDAEGRSWTDVSAWYWAASIGQTEGPWWSITRVRRTP